MYLRLDSCTKTAKSKLSGVNKEHCQAAFYKMMAAGVPDLTALSGDHQLTMWLCINVLAEFWTSSSPLIEPKSSATLDAITLEEVDVAHYIGGFVCCKLKQRSKVSEYRAVVRALESDDDPDLKTLVAAKSRGQLTHLSKDGQCIFAELEKIFRYMFPSSATNISEDDFCQKCLTNEVIQDCFHNCTHSLDTTLKDNVLMDIISLYFKVRINQKCKCVVDKIRNTKLDSKKEKALRSKLAR